MLQRVVVIVWDGDAVQLAVLVQLALVGVAAQPVLLQGFLSALDGVELLQENMAVVVLHMSLKREGKMCRKCTTNLLQQDPQSPEPHAGT